MGGVGEGGAGGGGVSFPFNPLRVVFFRFAIVLAMIKAIVIACFLLPSLSILVLLFLVFFFVVTIMRGGGGGGGGGGAGGGRATVIHSQPLPLRS